MRSEEFVGNGLRESPYHLVSAYDGGEGFRLTLEHAPDLLISDIDMPVMNGYEMCQRIKETKISKSLSSSGQIAGSCHPIEPKTAAAIKISQEMIRPRRESASSPLP